MPTYEYVCKECGHEFEKLQSMNDEPIRLCPQCGHISVHRKISGGTGLIFKGSGFYITDYGKKNHSPASPVKSAKPDQKPLEPSPKKSD